MLIRTDPDVLMIKSEELQNLANRMVRYTDELYEIESGMRRMSSLAECVIPVSAQIGRLTEEARALLAGADALSEIALLYRRCEQSSVETVYEGTAITTKYVKADKVGKIDPSQAGSFW